MFALSVSADGGVAMGDLDLAAAGLRGSSRTASTWRDSQGRAGAAAGASGILPEDVFDRQPIVTEEMVFVAQARIDNRDDVLGALGEPRDRWPILADSDVLHLAFRRWGEACLLRVTGDFSFAAWRRDSGEVVAGVDAGGAARLYYTAAGGRLIASSQLGALLAFPQTARALDVRALGLLAAPKIEPGATPYKEIRALIGGHVLSWSRGALETRRWWLPDTSPRLRYRDCRDYVLDAREHFERAVVARLRAVGGVATTLSGGLDSTLVAATAAQQLQRTGGTLDAYTSVPKPGAAKLARRGWEADEGPLAAEVAAMHPNMTHVLVPPDGRCALDIADVIHRCSYTPVRNPSNHLWLDAIFRNAAAAGNRVLLVGSKGNATLSPDETWMSDPPFGSERVKLALQLSKSQLDHRDGVGVRSILRMLLGARVTSLPRRLLDQSQPQERTGALLYTPQFHAAARVSLATYAPSEGRDAFAAFAIKPMAVWSAAAMPQWGAEYRDPTGDRLLIERILSYPWQAILFDGRSRGLARAMSEGLTPDAVRFRQARGEQLPEHVALIAAQGGRYRDALEHVATSPAFQEIFDIERVRDALQRLLGGEAGRETAHTIDRVLDVGLFISEAGA